MFARWSGKTFLLALVLAIGTSAAAQYKQVNLVSTLSPSTPHPDANLVNPWGLTYLPGSPFWVSDAFAGVATLYDGSGNIIPLVVTVPPASHPLAPIGLPTGIVANPTADFVISENDNAGPALFIFATLDGTISGWNPSVDLNNAVIAVDNSGESPFPASYTGLAFGRNSKGHLVIYAADSGGALNASNNRIDMYDSRFNLIGHFGDPDAPANMTVYGIQNINGELYVTYATFTFLGGGVVDVFDTDGNFLRRLTGNGPDGPLEAPWGLALAPADFGPLSNALLVGGVDDGHISAFDPSSGAFLGQLSRKKGKPIAISGLWGLKFGGGTPANGNTNELFFNAGTDGYSRGLFGKIVVP